MSATKKTIPISYFINIVLMVVLLSVVGFGWYYLKGRSPVDTIQTIAKVGPPNPEYLYTIYGPDDKRFKAPHSTYVSDDRIYVADTYNNRVVVFDYNGNYLRSFGKRGNHEGAMLAPTDIVEVDNELYVVDVDLGGVEVWDKEGKFQRMLGNLKFTRPFSIAFHNDRFYVLDIATMKVNIIDREGNFINNFGEKGDGDGQFYFFYDLAVRDNQLYIADSNNNRVQVFDLEGNHLRTLTGKDERDMGGFSIPRGVAFDAQDNLYTAEMIGNQVSILNPDGIYISGFSYAEPEKENIEDQLVVPTSVFVDENNRLYVTELGNARILVYQI